LWPSNGTPLELEKKVEAVIGDVEWVGYIDRLERTPDGLKVVDYKTSRTPTAIKDANTSIQLAFYATAVADELNEPVVEAQMWFPRATGKSVATRSLDMEMLTEVREKMEEVTKSIQDEIWEPRVNARCDRCEFRLSCPAWPEGQGAFLP
jgi:RecB family exonuclease